MKSGQAKRSWLFSLGLALTIVGVGVALSAVVNPLLGRYVHWDSTDSTGASHLGHSPAMGFLEIPLSS